MEIAYSKFGKMSNVLSLNAQIYHLKLCICTFYEQNITKKLTLKKFLRKLILGSVRIDDFCVYSRFSKLTKNSEEDGNGYPKKRFGSET